MAQNMGFGLGLEQSSQCIKQKFRWLFKIPEISGEGVYALPPTKASRPNLNIKEIQVEHLDETIFYPGKVDYKPITLTLYDLKKNRHPVFDWLNELYDAETGEIKPPLEEGFIKTAFLELYNGCGDTIETWKFENIWPNQMDFGDLDMSSSEIITCDLGLRYSRAYIYRD